ncbi:MAG: hypothetical protein BAA01_06350 [Bacillus thermozeamaize]|uniref:DUF58 domain-containing protein n=1 Tax=Bacillus thermozeamaize TaxID=230954 RepID=A0A1Y3PEL3_9BACI|nr:MAG: hypothetical protein BAA01_06350 [Bacillus thermozeamaize]
MIHFYPKIGGWYHGMKQTNLWLVVFLWLASFVFWRFQGGFVSGFLFYTVTVVSVYEGLVWLVGGYGVSVETIIEDRKWTRGDTLRVQLKLRRRFPMPFLWIKVEQELPRRLQAVCSPEMMFRLPWFQRTLTFAYELSPLPRGQFVLGEVRVTTGDLFGLLHRQIRLHVREELVVYPRYQLLRGWAAGAGEHQAVRTPVPHRNLRQQESTLVAGIRDWQPGDRLNQIHWKQSARTTGLKSKLPERQGKGPVLIFLDLYRHSYSEASLHLLERGIELALSLAYAAVSSGQSVGLVAEGRHRVRLTPKADQRQLQQICRYLAVEEAVGEMNLPSLIRQQLPQRTGGQQMVIISPRLDKALVELVRQGVQVQRATSIQVFWLTESETERAQEAACAQLLRLGVPVYRVAEDRLQNLFLQHPAKEGGHVGS